VTFVGNSFSYVAVLTLVESVIVFFIQWVGQGKYIYMFTLHQNFHVPRCETTLLWPVSKLIGNLIFTYSFVVAYHNASDIYKTYGCFGCFRRSTVSSDRPF